MKKNALKLIGNTPIYNLDNTNIFIKLEKYNLGGSVKDRAVMGMLQDALESGKINENTILVEPTSGNTGISLAMLGAIYGIKVIIIMPESMSVERRQIIKAYGAQLILTPKELGTKGAIAKAEEIISSNSNAIMLQQFINPSNPQYHYDTTAEEILNAVPNIDIFIAGVGTGGTVSGVSRKIKQSKAIHTIAVEPVESAVISGNNPGPHPIQGIGAGFIPNNYDSSLVDEVITISGEEAKDTAKAFMRETGISVGISSGATIAVAKKVAAQHPDKIIVTVAPDGVEKYLSVLEFEDVNYL